MLSRKRNIFNGYGLLLVGLLMLGLSLIWEPLFFKKQDQQAEGRRIFKVFEKKETVIRAGMDRLASMLSAGKRGKDIWLETPPENQENSGIYYTVSENDSLVFWSSSLVAFENGRAQSKPEGSLQKMPTGWYYIFSKRSGQYLINGYMLIKRDFPYQNRYVQSSFQDDFHLSDQCEVISEEKPGNIQVFCSEGKFHFGIQFKNQQGRTAQEEIPVLLFFLLFVLFTTAQFNSWINNRPLKSWSKLGFSFLFAGSSYLALTLLRIPNAVYANKIFAPSHFAYGQMLSSLGDYLLLSFFLFSVAQSFFVFFRKEKKIRPFSIENGLLFAFVSCYFVLSCRLFLVLLNNSDISLELYSNMSLSIPNILASCCIALQMVGLGVLLIRVRCLLKTDQKYFAFFVLSTLTLAILLLILLILGVGIPFEIILSYLIISLCFDRIGIDLLSKYKLTSLLVYGLLLAFGLNLAAQKEISRRKANIQQVMAVNLATERDPAAEIFLSDFETKVVKDTVIQPLLVPPYQNFKKYLAENYFTGFWNNYESQITVCSSIDSVLLTETRRRFPCLEFFKQLEAEKGVSLGGSDFYFMDRLNGRISYLGELHLVATKGNRPLVVFIELNSKIIPEGKGYPQLLMDQQTAKRNRNEGYSYAKYFGGKLVDRGGAYSYDPSISSETIFDKEFNYYQRGGFQHCLYKRSAENYVIVSYPMPSIVEQGRGFPPLFLFIYFLGFTWILLSQRAKFISRQKFELSGKIQFTLVSTLLVLLFLIGLGLIRYNYLEFQRSMKETLDQKVRAISAELGLRIGGVNKLDSIHEYLGDQLVEISDITWTDINIYDLKGRLAASSRHEIFEQGLTSERMNPQAYRTLNILGGATFLHNENLGKMEFFSVYAPLFNRSDELLGYVNLPYFNRQDEFTKQVSGFIVAFINLYILLVLLTMIIALAISTRLTVPLLQIEQKLKGIALGRENALIEYRGEDEIGRLVDAYNQKVKELADSAALLARSERESAWKEMARQIAHEINNPLTPMKLNIQYLQKIKDEGASNFDAYFNQVTRMLVAQIDTLSAIAATFSDFARLPSTRIEPVEMTGLIREVSTLFEAPGEYSLSVECPDREVYVLGDRDQLRRALVNIVRNAMQAILNQADGSIKVTLELTGDQVKIDVTDNGPGIPEADRSRLFEPNFTTKSGGMGLGLAITKTIIENYKGEIRYESNPGRTIFSMIFLHIII